MSFVLGVVFGIAFGLAIIVAFVKSENARSKQRTDLASGIAAFARMTVEDSRKIFTPEQYPSWVVFSNQQKVKSLTFFFRMYLVGRRGGVRIFRSQFFFAMLGF